MGCGRPIEIDKKLKNVHLLQTVNTGKAYYNPPLFILFFNIILQQIIYSQYFISYQIRKYGKPKSIRKDKTSVARYNGPHTLVSRAG